MGSISKRIARNIRQAQTGHRSPKHHNRIRHEPPEKRQLLEAQIAKERRETSLPVD